MAAADAKFTAALTQWKDILKQLRDLRTQYLTATDEQAAQIRDRWNVLIGEGEQLIPLLRKTGLQAYTAAPGQDRELERFLLKVVSDDIKHDRYEPAAELSAGLIAAGCEVKPLRDEAGLAAFATNQYEAAETYLNEAQQAGVISQKGLEILSVISDYKQFWATEQQIREQEAQANDLPRVKMTTTDGDIIIELFENEAPDTVGNFISLVEKGFYDNLTFHRVLEGFMAQGGCPLGTGTGGPGYNIYCECYGPNHRKHFRGSLSMAHAGRDTGGSQFFLTFVPTPHLNGKHTVFGRVIEGLDLLEKIQRIDPSSSDGQAKPDKILKAEVIRKREHEYKPNKA